MTAPVGGGAPRLEPLPDILRCSTQGCTETHAGRGDTADALAVGWIMIDGLWFCPADAERGRQRTIADMQSLDGIDQSEPGEIPELDIGGEG